ncbi:hypothetical protein G3I60_43385 [Streptomyces sp. SID13666]|uniref:hypothetical protein n=1 Tax=Streptomyces TaxID=1883 RepID=UPI001105DFBF|nr:MULTISPECIES: hypothetical protein [Streptomyces]MCZ4101409.1 hypothetical protein [Streptomyces sp. H39-C1]NEA60825.1 hypothetical protein [Streptomyces sp. SID13666]NEA77289.1 hypothetical protein [Streptomyces sp. SID13588]QNA75859.1 hypothetical protein C8250_031765 [Streptomyces sp. So13.3]
MRPDHSRSVPLTDICDACARPLTDGCHLNVVPDSSAIHASDRARDGRRLIAACSPEHLMALQQEYRERPFVPEELWAGQIRRALAQQHHGLTSQALSEATGLDDLQIQRAMEWEQHRAQSCEHHPHLPETG